MWWKTIFPILGLIVVLIASFIAIGNILFRRMVESDARKILGDIRGARARDTDSAKATIEYRGVNGSAVFHFNEIGEINNVVADRYMTDSGEHVLRKWSTPIHEYMEVNGIRVPSKGVAVWHLSSGDFEYIELEVTQIEYNNHSMH